MSELFKNLHFNNIYFRGQTFRQKDLEVAIDNLAKYIDKKLISPSPFIMLTAYNHIKTVIAYYAILKAGRIAVIIDPGIKNLELSEMIADVDPAAIIFMNSVALSWNYEEEIIFRKPDKNFVIHSDLTDVCTIAYTNAEDGFAKGAMLTEKNLLTSITEFPKIEEFTTLNTHCPVIPYYHLYGLGHGMLIPLGSGGSLLITDNNFSNFSGIIREIHNYKVTQVYSIPSFYYLLSKYPGISEKFETVTDCFTGGIKLTKSVHEKFYRASGKKIREGYGLTETSPLSIHHFKDDTNNIDAIGKPLPYCDVKIMNGNGECLPSEIGEICINGDNVFKGYFNNETATIKAFCNNGGWLHTGDYGKMDDNGNVYYCGLKKNMFNVAGNNVYPKKLERLMKYNQNVSDLIILAEDTLIQGQIVRARIKLHKKSKKAQEEFRKWCYNNISYDILPKYWDFN